MNFLAATARVCPWAWGGQEPPRFRLNRSLLSLICSLHKSRCLEPTPTDRSLNRAPTEARVRTADVVEAKRLNLQNRRRRKQKRKSQSRKTYQSNSHVGSAPLHWFKLIAGINGILPAFWRAPAIYSVARLSQLRCALKGSHCLWWLDHCGARKASHRKDQATKRAKS
jgi:hypothetical protein